MRVIYRVCVGVVLLLFATACGSSTQADYRWQGRRVVADLVELLNDVNNYDELASRRARLEELFSELADVMIAARELQGERGDEPLVLAEDDRVLSAQLRGRLEQIYLIPGARELIEDCQMEGLYRLDRAERR